MYKGRSWFASKNSGPYSSWAIVTSIGDKTRRDVFIAGLLLSCLNAIRSRKEGCDFITSKSSGEVHSLGKGSHHGQSWSECRLPAAVIH